MPAAATSTEMANLSAQIRRGFDLEVYPPALILRYFTVAHFVVPWMRFLCDASMIRDASMLSAGRK
jgi:hypothetical protein